MQGLQRYKNMRLQAYNNLLEIIRKVEKDATNDNVKKEN